MSGPYTILSVGRDPTVLTHRHALLTRAGYAVTSAAQPVKALHLLDSHAFDLVLVGCHARSERVHIERVQKDRNVRVLFLACHHLSSPSTLACHEQEILSKIAEALSSGTLQS